MLLSNFLQAAAFVLDKVLYFYMWVVIISALLSWVNPDPYNPIVRMLRNLTEPLFMRLRRRMPFLIAGGFDLTPVAVIFIIYFLQIFVVKSLAEFALTIR